MLPFHRNSRKNLTFDPNQLRKHESQEETSLVLPECISPQNRASTLSQPSSATSQKDSTRGSIVLHGETSPSFNRSSQAKKSSFGTMVIKTDKLLSVHSCQGSPKSSPLVGCGFEKKDKLICLFCGGKGCKHENWLNNKNSVIQGLDSDWITDDLLAMQRPSSRLIKEYNIVEQFKMFNINTIINVQEHGEHPSCGDGILEASGFSYLPEEFTDHGVYFYTLGWKDMTATDFTHMMKIMNIMQFSLQNGQKVAVHCHAGRGRTILVIGAWMIYHMRMSAQDVIAHCAAKRSGTLSKDKQKKFLYDFEKYLIKSKRIFHEIPAQSVQEVIKAQKTLLSSEKFQSVKYCPLVLHEVTQKIEKMLKVDRIGGQSIMQAFLNLNHSIFPSKWDDKHEEALKNVKSSINRMDYKVLEGLTGPRIICQLVLDFFENLSLPSFAYDTLFKIEELSEAFKDLFSIDEETIFGYLTRIEFELLLKFSTILSLINQDEPTTEVFNSQYGRRVALSLLLLRKKHDNIFTGRTMQTTDIDNKHIKCISELIVLFSRKPIKELELSYKGSTSMIMNRSRTNSKADVEDMISPTGSPTKLSKFAQYKGSANTIVKLPLSGGDVSEAGGSEKGI